MSGEGWCWVRGGWVRAVSAGIVGIGYERGGERCSFLANNSLLTSSLAKIISFTFGGKNFLPEPNLHTSPCPYPYYFVFLFFIVCSIRFGFLARFCMKYFTLFPYTLHLTLAHTLVLTWPIVFRCPCCLMQLNTHGQHTRILRYKGCLCECAIDAASLMYYPKKRNVCIAYAGF